MKMFKPPNLESTQRIPFKKFTLLKAIWLFLILKIGFCCCHNEISSKDVGFISSHTQRCAYELFSIHNNNSKKTMNWNDFIKTVSVLSSGTLLPSTTAKDAPLRLIAFYNNWSCRKNMNCLKDNSGIPISSLNNKGTFDVVYFCTQLVKVMRMTHILGDEARIKKELLSIGVSLETIDQTNETFFINQSILNIF